MSIVSKDLVFATEHHQHQHRKGTKIPYMVQLLNVCKLVAENNCSDEVLAAALLHDVVEDTDVTIEEVAATFGDTVAEIVKVATELDKLEKKAIERKATGRKEKSKPFIFCNTKQALISCWFQELISWIIFVLLYMITPGLVKHSGNVLMPAKNSRPGIIHHWLLSCRIKGMNI